MVRSKVEDGRIVQTQGGSNRRCIGHAHRGLSEASRLYVPFRADGTIEYFRHEGRELEKDATSLEGALMCKPCVVEDDGGERRLSIRSGSQHTGSHLITVRESMPSQKVGELSAGLGDYV